MGFIKMLTQEADSFDLNVKDVHVEKWSKRGSISFNEDILLTDLRVNPHPDGLHYHSITGNIYEVEQGIEPFLRSDGVVIGYLSGRSPLTLYQANNEIQTGNYKILEKVGLGISWGGLQTYQCTSISDRDEVKEYVNLVRESDSYIEGNDPAFEKEIELIKRGEYGSLCGAVYKNYQNSGYGTLILLPRPENLSVRPNEWLKQTLSVAFPYLPERVKDKLKPDEGESGEDDELDDSVQNIVQIFGRFHKIATQLERRYNDRETIEIRTEHDVQDLVHALLWLEFEDIRDEEQSPSHGGSSSRIDFLVKNEKIGVEIKHARTDNREKQLKNQIAEDKEHYQAHPSCEKLLCFIYDPDLVLENPQGFENDLSNPQGPLSTSVLVFPK